MNLAFSKDLIKDVATISLNVSDLLKSRKRRSLPANRARADDLDYFTSDSEFQWRERQVRVSFVYRFNQQKKKQRGNRDDFGGEDFQG